MSRTYRCTNGASKKLKGTAFQRVCWTWRDDERNADIDYNDGLDAEYARHIRQGFKGGLQRNHGKYTRKHTTKQEKQKMKKKLHNCIKHDCYEDMVSYTNKERVRWT